MKKIWGQLASAIVAGKEDSFQSLEKQTRRSNVFDICSMPAVAVAVLAFVTVLAAVTAKAQTSFYSPLVISGTSGSTNYYNTGVVADTNCPNIAGFVPNAPLWFSWTAPKNGEVELDTIGSLGSTVSSNATESLGWVYFTNYLVTANGQIVASGATNITSITVNQVVITSNLVDIISFPPTAVTNVSPLDTVLAVFTGSAINGLNQVAANDNLFPINNSGLIADLNKENADVSQVTISDSGDYATFVGRDSEPGFEYIQPYYGPSHLRFNATAGTTYYFVVDTKPFSTSIMSSLGILPATGSVSLQWAYQSSGVFRFATEDFDAYSGFPLYQTAETESDAPDGDIIVAGGLDENSAVFTYYPFNAPGVLVTVTREAGSSGRCTVDYSTEDGTNLVPWRLQMPPNEVPGQAFRDYIPVSGQLVFDDYEMSKTILVPIIDGGTGVSGGSLVNAYFGITLSNAQVDPYESGDISQPRVDPVFGTAMVKVLNETADPYGPDLVPVVIGTNILIVTGTNTPPTITTNNFPVTNLVDAVSPTNSIINFEKANYRVPEDVTSPNSQWTYVALYVERFGTNLDAETVTYRINNFLDNDLGGDEEQNIYFPLQPGSDYAGPTPPNTLPTRGTNADFTLATGSISFPASPAFGYDLQKITFTVNNAMLTRFNRDFIIDLYQEKSFGGVTVPVIPGMVAQTKVTILFNDQNPPAGSVDELYNADFNLELALPSANSPSTIPLNDAIPGVFGGYVKSLLLLTNNEALIAGDFVSYNGFLLYNNGHPINNIALIDTNGNLDQSFSPNSGADGAINSVVETTNGQYIIGGNFVSFNGIRQPYIARINSDGSLDSSFNPVVNGPVWSVALQADGKVLIGGSFNQINTQTEYCLARLNANGSLDASFNPGTVLSGTVNAVSVEPTNLAASADIMVGGSFSVNGQPYDNVARFTANGVIDNTFSNLFAGADNTVNCLAWQPDGKVVVGGAFANFNGIPNNGLVRLNWDGSLDTTNFFIGVGANDIVWNITLQLDGTMYVGGQFTEINGTHRSGFARLYSNGTVDTTFMDTAYNQFAGLKRIFADDFAAVYTAGIQSDSNVIIGGEFNQVGGGEAYTNVCDSLDEEFGIQNSFYDPNLWVEPKVRDGVRNRSGVARLIGGSTPGPGNIQFQLPAYSANKNGSSLTVSLVRTNGALGPASANFSILPGSAQGGSDYFYDSTAPLYWVAAQFTTHPSRNRSDGLFGLSGTLEDIYGQFLTFADLPINNQSLATVSVINNTQKSGNQNAQFQLANPSGDDEFYLGGQNIPLGSALGASTVPFTVIDNTSAAGQIGFISTNYIATNTPAVINLVRSNGVFGTVTVRCWATNGTAVSGQDFTSVANLSRQFGGGVTSNNYQVAILQNGLISTNFVQKTITLSLTALSGGNATYGISNATLTLVNPNFQGYLTFSATNYVGNENAGSMSFIVNRVAGNAGQISVQYATTNGTAINGTNYIGATNSLSWGPGDSSSRVVNIPILDTYTVGGSTQFGVRLFNPTNSAGLAKSLFYTGSPGSITNATMTISNNDSYGTLQFSSPSYLVSANGGYVTLTAVRTGGATGNVSVNYATSNGSNTTAFVNYMPTNGVLAFASNQVSASFNVFVSNGGTQYPSNFFFNVTLSNPTNAVLGSPTNAVVNILSTQYNWSPGTTNGLFNANLNGSVLALALTTNGQVLAGGDFTSVNGTPQDYVARLNPDGSLDGGFAAGANGPVQAVVCQTDGNVVIGGAFTTADGLIRNNIARFMTNGFLDTSFNPGPGADGPVYALAETFINGVRDIYAGGAFTEISSGVGNSIGASLGIARLNNDGTLDTSFNIGSGADGTVYAIAVYPTNSIYAGDLLIGGTFVHYNGATVNGIARLTSSGLLDATFNPGSAATNGAVDAIAIQPDGRILVGGSFSTFNGMNANNILRLNTDGSTDTGFTTTVGPGANNTVDEIVVQPDNRILVVGQFTQFNGLIRNSVTRLLPTGATDLTINFGTGANGAINAALIQPSTGIITLGGAFTTYDGALYDHIVQIYGLSLVGSGAFQLSAGSYQVAETGFVAPITILRTGGTSGTNADGSGNVFVNFSTVPAGSTAVAGVNYSPISTNLSFAPGEILKTVNIPIFDDIDYSTNSWLLNMGLSGATPPAIIGSPYSATLDILNVNSAISFQANFTTVYENVGGGVANVDIIRQGATNATSSVQFYTTTNTSTGIPGVDYIPTNETVTFNPGVSDVTAQVLIISNSTLEKTVGMVITNPVNSLLYAPSNATLTIIDNVSPPGELLFASTNYTVNESSGSVVVTVLRTNGFSGKVTVDYTTVDGTAQAGLNYLTNSGTLTFNNNVSSQPITITLPGNNPPEGPVNFSVVLSNPSIATLITPTNTTVTIVDDVNTGVSFLNPTNSFIETAGTISIPVERLGNTNNSFTINYSTTNGTAVAGVNYVTNGGTLPFAAGQTLGGISINLINNEDVSNLMFNVKLSSPSAGVQLVSPSNSVVVVQAAGAGLAFTTPTNSVLKDAGFILVPVVCLNPSAEPPVINSNAVLTVNYSTINGTALAGEDYTAVSGTLIFTNGLATTNIVVPIINNSLITGLRTFTVSLSDPSPVPPGELTSPSSEVVTIIDSNSGLSFSNPNYSILNGGLANITVIRQDNTNTAATVNYATIGGGSAVPGTDYYPTNGVLTFTNGQISANFAVTVIGSSGVQPNKSILLQLSDPTPANAVLTAPNVATLTIYNENGSFVVPAGVSLVSSNMPPGGILQSNQLVSLAFGFRDAGGTNVANLMATLLPVSGITSPQPSTAQSYGPLMVNGPAVSRVFNFKPVGTNGQTVLATFKLQDNANLLGTNTFALTVGSWTTTFYNTNTIIIPPGPASFVAAIASPYPSIITVTNVGGVLIGTSVTLTNFTHTSPQAVGALVVSPAEQDTLIMADVGSPNVGANNVTLTFSDTATNSLPSTTTTSTPITNGVYKPTQDGPIPNFP